MTLIALLLAAGGVMLAGAGVVTFRRRGKHTA
ncbi:LPXTG cell wall anchor domain-containing protein [Kribbella sp. NPDC003557]